MLVTWRFSACNASQDTGGRREEAVGVSVEGGKGKTARTKRFDKHACLLDRQLMTEVEESWQDGERHKPLLL
jgi:hypothetical protein